MHDSSLVTGSCVIFRRKAIFLAPTRALCRQVVEDWNEQFGRHGVKCIAATSDKRVSQRMLDDANVIVFTPEKLEHMTRKWSSYEIFFENLDLVIMDEIHLLSEERRGAVLEIVVSRLQFIRRLLTTTLPPIRFAAASGTLPNTHDLARWLGAPVPRGVLIFGPEFRPCPLETRVYTYGSPRQNEFTLHREMNSHIHTLIAQYSQGKPAMVFCTSRKGARQTAELLSDHRQERIRLTPNQVEHRNKTALSKIKDSALSLCIQRAGVAWHTAELSTNDQVCVEELFRQGLLSVLVCTSTLAQGINLPAHLVIIKGTKAYRGPSRGMEELSISNILQMTGRAGRFGLDTSGYAIIMTHPGDKARFESILSGSERVKSVLETDLQEALLHEIHLGAITTFSDAYAWLETTFFFVERGVSIAEKSRLKAVVSTHLKAMRLNECLVLTDSRTLCVTDLGAWICSQSLRLSTGLSFFRSLHPETDGGLLPPIQNLFELDDDASISAIVKILASASEFYEQMQLRRDQKLWLNEVSWRLGRFRGRKNIDRVNSAQDKVFQLIQASLARDIPAPKDSTLREELLYVQTEGIRLLRSLLGCAKILLKSSVAVNLQLLLRCFETRSWPSAGELLQLPFVGAKTIAKLHELGAHTLSQLLRVCTYMPDTFQNEIGPTRASKIAEQAKQLVESKCTLQISIVHGKHCVSLIQGTVPVSGYEVFVTSKYTLLASAYMTSRSPPIMFETSPGTPLRLFAIHPKFHGIDFTLDMLGLQVVNSDIISVPNAPGHKTPLHVLQLVDQKPKEQRKVRSSSIKAPKRKSTSACHVSKLNKPPSKQPITRDQNSFAITNGAQERQKLYASPVSAKVKTIDRYFPPRSIDQRVLSDAQKDFTKEINLSSTTTSAEKQKLFTNRESFKAVSQLANHDQDVSRFCSPIIKPSTKPLHISLSSAPLDVPLIGGKRCETPLQRQLKIARKSSASMPRPISEEAKQAIPNNFKNIRKVQDSPAHVMHVPLEISHGGNMTSPKDGPGISSRLRENFMKECQYTVDGTNEAAQVANFNSISAGSYKVLQSNGHVCPCEPTKDDLEALEPDVGDNFEDVFFG